MSMQLQQVYDISAPPVVAHGLAVEESQLKKLLQGPVNDILQDSTGKEELEELLRGLATTEFEQAELNSILSAPTTSEYEDWLIGEALAEALLVEKDGCCFPWPTSRDLKNPEASPAGCDLTGFQQDANDENSYRFCFGEVKTSWEDKYPPSVMNSLGKQLSTLCQCKNTRDHLLRYLGLHSKGQPWEDKFRSAAEKYLQSAGHDVSVYGVLVRDTVPNKKDLESKTNQLAKTISGKIFLCLYALYIPLGDIQNLPSKLKATQEVGGKQ